MKNKKIVLLAATMFSVVSIFTGCATHENVAEHHHHPGTQFDGTCAYSVANGKFDVKANPDLTLDHNGVRYFFSSVEARNKFNAHIDEQAKRAQENWELRRSRNR